MSRISDDRSRTVCDREGCDAVKPPWSNWAGDGGAAWFHVEWWDGHKERDYCTREHMLDGMGPTMRETV